MKTEMNKIIIAVAILVTVFTGCKGWDDTYQWADNRGLFSQVRWSFTQAPTADTYRKDAKFKTYFKTPVSPRSTYDFTVYNNSRVSANQMKAEFTGGTLWLDGTSIPSGTPFAVNGANKLTFIFKPADSRPKGIFPISVYVFAQGLEKQLTTYNLELFDNIPPQASFIVTQKSGLDYDLDAGLSTDGDTDFGGRLKDFTWTITDAANAAQKQSFSIPATQKVYSYSFPYAGSFKVKLIVTDSDDATTGSEKTVDTN